MKRFACAALVLALAAGGATSCKKTETAAPPVAAAPPPVSAPMPVQVVQISLGKSLNPDHTIAEPTTTFAPTDKLIASVSTQGAAPSATLTARWTYQDGQTVNESSKSIAPTGPATTDFTLEKPDGWPAGQYQVEVLLNGVSAGKRELTVQ
jgi:hypothetical protein